MAKPRRKDSGGGNAGGSGGRAHGSSGGGRGSGGRRSSGTRSTGRGPAETPKRRSQSSRGHVSEVDRRRRFHVPWSRRIGVIGALMLLGASLVMAAGGRFEGGPSGSPGPGSSQPIGSAGTGVNLPPDPTAGSAAATPTAPGGPTAPTLTPPVNAYTRVGSVDVSGTVPEGLVRAASQRLRVFVDGKIARQVKLPDGPSFVVRAVPLKVGRHAITASINGPDGETRRSEPMVITVDVTPPALQLTGPLECDTVYVDHATVAGKLLGGHEVAIENQTTGATALAAPTPDGAFTAEIPISLGVNALVVMGQDLAGNTSQQHIRVVRAEGKPTASLTISSTRIKIARLPASITIETVVLDEARAPIPGAAVTFTLSPPGLPTSTYHAETDDSGTARWEQVGLSPDGAIPGKGFATVLVTLPGTSKTLQETAPFTFE
jgi:hypothetical protein